MLDFGSKTFNLTAKISRELDNELAKIAKKHDRSKSYVTNNLLIKGLAAYMRTGTLSTSEDMDEMRTVRTTRRARGISKSGETIVTAEKEYEKQKKRA